MSDIFTLIKLRWALEMSSFKRSVWTKILQAFLILFYLLVIVFFAVIGWGYGSIPQEKDYQFNSFITGLRVSLSSGIIFIFLFLLLMTVSFAGNGSVLRIQPLRLFGFTEKRMATGFIVSDFCGFSRVVLLLSLISTVTIWRDFGFLPIFAHIIASVMVVLTISIIFQIILVLVESTNSRKKNIIYYVLVIGSVIFLNAMNFIVHHNEGAGIDQIYAIISWLPLVSAVQLPLDVVTSQWALAAGHFIESIVIFGALYYFLVRIFHRVFYLRKEGNVVRVHARGLGIFEKVPDSPVGAVAACMLIYVRQDLRRLSSLVSVVLMCAIGIFLAQFNPLMAFLYFIFGIYTFALTESNNIAYDGKPFVNEVICGVRGKHDRLGRMASYSLYAVPIVAVLTIVYFGIAHFLFNVYSFTEIIASVGVVIAAFGTSVGLSAITSTVFSYPVSSFERPMSRVSGGTAGKSFLGLLSMFIGILSASPTILTWLYMLFFKETSLMWFVLPLGIINAAIVLVIGYVVGSKLFDGRSVELVRNVREYSTWIS